MNTPGSPSQIDTLSSTDYVRAVVNILEDIGDEKQRLEITQKAVLNILEDLEDEKRSAQEANRMKSEFLANMSHELRTPLNSIIGFSELMSDGKVGPIAPNHKEYLGDILTSARHLLQLINDVLDLAKVEAGKMEFDRKPFLIDVLLYGIRDTLRSIAAARNITVDVKIEPNLKEVIGDESRLKQVLYNYLSNALKFTAEGGYVVLSATVHDSNYYKISVLDNGEGIASEQLSRLFIEFEQLDASISKRHQGTGLGLALTKRLVEAQGGTVGVESTLGQGSDFYAILPTFMPDKQTQKPNLLIDNIDKPPNSLPNILVIENEPAVRENILLTLTGEGYSPFSAINISETIKYLDLRSWDIILLTLELPDIDYTKLISLICSKSPNSLTPVIAIANQSEVSLVPDSIKNILFKPINNKKLIETVNKIQKSQLENHHILIIEDEPNDLKLVIKHLQDAGYRTTGLTCCEDAVGRLKQFTPDLIVLDLLMPAMNGFELLNYIKNHPQYSNIPIIIWSENEPSKSTLQTDFSDVAAYLLKSDGHDSLLEQVKLCIR
ncbi:hypothetical protein AMS58_06235 [Pseudoalteromonas porphyrae]|uniref:response regulator n=1 Tax=Pseudoalteromonas porphyrae TaxID=187330 RepID=UPI0006BAABFA|nr:response regulator [Pseudoalteromonas porphyrae]KPH95773.1 hypothetical protein AMS58_06235 [Pseudoalteromonas porphyrae]